jgi:ribosomal protein S12 methylthiotransferase accessory factor
MEVLFPGDRKIDVLYRGFRIETDQPRGDGSPGDAPEPLDLFFASLATCVGLTAAVFCRARDLPTDGMRLSLRRTWDPEEKRYTRVRLDLALPKGFPVKYRSAVVQAMGHCSVKKHLAHPPELLFEARLADEPAVAPE